MSEKEKNKDKAKDLPPPENNDRQEDPAAEDEDEDVMELTRQARTPLIIAVLVFGPILLAILFQLLTTEHDGPETNIPEAAALQKESADVQGTQPRPSSTRRRASVEQTCDMSAWVGLKMTPALRQYIEETGKTARIIGPDEMYTFDYVKERLNFQLNEEGVITSAWCG